MNVSCKRRKSSVPLRFARLKIQQLPRVMYFMTLRYLTHGLRMLIVASGGYTFFTSAVLSLSLRCERKHPDQTERLSPPPRGHHGNQGSNTRLGY